MALTQQNSIVNTKDFANHVTINLFKKRTNLRSHTRQTRQSSVRRTSRPIVTKTIKLTSGRSKSQVSSGTQKSQRQVNEVSNKASDISSLERIAEQVITPLSSSVESSFDTRTEVSLCPDDPDSPVVSYISNSVANSPSKDNSNSPKMTNNPSSIPLTSRKKPFAQNDDLTSLSWLQSLDMGGVVPHLAAPPTPPASPPLSSNAYDPKFQKEESPQEKIDYSVDGSIKPPFSYAALIGMAMKENGNKMTLSAIYKWIKEHYIYYKTADQSWQVNNTHGCFFLHKIDYQNYGKLMV